MYAVLHPPNFSTQAAAKSQPELRRLPFALLDGEAPFERVYAANKAARLLGVEIGMTRLQVESFAEVVIRPRAIDDETSAQLSLHEIACQFSPRIEYVDRYSGTYALDIQGMGRLFADSAQLANKLRHRIMAAGFVANVAVASNFHTAVCLACAHQGVSVTPSGEEAAAMAGLPLHVLGLEPEQEATFSMWGIRTCGELAAREEKSLIARIGQPGRRLHALARGTWSHLMLPMEPSFEAGLVEHIELDFPVEILESLLFVLSRMTDALLVRAKEKARAIALLRVVLLLDDKTRYERIVRPALPLQDTPTLLKLMQLDLEMHPPQAAIVGLELHAQSAPPHRAQHGLFLPQAPEPGRLEILLARLRKLLGEERVGSPELTDDHRPNAFRVVPFQPPVPLPAKGALGKEALTAFRVCRPPQGITVMLQGDSPFRVFYEGQRYSVLEVAGPWRVNGQWWSKDKWSRDEWDVRLCADSLERVSRIAFDPRTQRWYMQGTYD